ncbi:MAG: SIMPL domain-containing protein [bacterium]
MEQETKKIELTNRLFYLAVVLAGGFFISVAAQLYMTITSSAENYPRELTVSATGRTFIVPDIALVSLGVSTEGKDVKTIVSENNQKMSDITKEIKALGVEDKDIQTANYSLTPQYDYPQYGERIFRGYVVNQEIRVKVRDFTKIGDVLTRATEKGANLIGDFQFTVEDEAKAKQTARTEAIKKAKEKAGQIAKETGLKMGKIINIYEDSYYNPTANMANAKYETGGGSPSPAADIQPGTQEITVTTSLVYRVK